jgi:hypothetical protein
MGSSLTVGVHKSKTGHKFKGFFFGVFGITERNFSLYYFSVISQITPI